VGHILEGAEKREHQISQGAIVLRGGGAHKGAQKVNTRGAHSAFRHLLHNRARKTILVFPVGGRRVSRGGGKPSVQRFCLAKVKKPVTGGKGIKKRNPRGNHAVAGKPSEKTLLRAIEGKKSL